MWQIVVASLLVIIAFVFVGRRMYRFVRSVRTKNKRLICQDCPLVNACTSDDEQTGKCPQTTTDKAVEDPH